MLEAMKVERCTLKVMGLSETVEDRTKDGGGTKDTSATEDEMPQKTRSPRGVRPHLGLKIEDTHRLGRAWKHALPSVASPPDYLRLPVLDPDLTPPLLGPEDEDFEPGMLIRRSNLR